MRATATFEAPDRDRSGWDEGPAGTLARARVAVRFRGEAEGTSLAEVSGRGGGSGGVSTCEA